MMGKETCSNPAPHSHHNPSLLVLPKEESPGRSPAPFPSQVGNSGGGDRVKRDEWSEGAVSTLLEAYETKWVLRNRAKLKGHDWEDVARLVSSRANCTKSPKTQTQCKNKIESMKKRYRSESAAPDPSSWPLYQRLDVLLRGTPAMVASTQQPPVPHPVAVAQTPMITYNTPLVLLDPPLPLPLPPLPPAPPPGLAQNSHGSNGIDRVAAKEDGVGVGIKLRSSQVSDKNSIDTDSSTPALYSLKNHDLKSKKVKSKKNNKKMVIGGRKKDGRSQEREIAESIRWLAEAIVRSEQSRMETMKEVERMRIEAEARRGEMDLKRTEIIANTQLEIARILSGGGAGKCIDSSLRIGRH